jgi:hypothetical protein
MLRSIAGGLGLLVIVVGGIVLGQGVGLMIAIGICLLAAARYRDWAMRRIHQPRP